MFKKIKNKIFYKKEGVYAVALVGVSGWGDNYLRKLSLDTKFDIQMIMDINEVTLNNIEKRYKYKTTKKLEDILFSDIDTIFVVLPNHLHFDFVKKLLEAKKNVYIEKPLANTTDEANKLKELAEKNKVILYTCHNQSFEWYIKVIGKIIKKNSLGKIFDIEIERSLPTSFNMKEDDWRNDSLKCPTGPLLQLGVHFIDFLNEWFGEFELVHSSLRSLVAENDDYFSANVKYQDIPCKLKFSYVSNNIFKISINAQSFNLLFDGKELKKIYHNGKVEIVKVKQNDSLQDSIDEFYKFIKEKNIQSNISRTIKVITSIERLENDARNI